jgi:hypothetical protein
MVSRAGAGALPAGRPATPIDRELAPPPGLERHVACLWELAVRAAPGGHVQRVMPDGCIDLLGLGPAARFRGRP